MVMGQTIWLMGDDDPRLKDIDATYVVNVDAARLQRHDAVDDSETGFLVVKEVGAYFDVLYHERDESMSFNSVGKTLGGQYDVTLQTTRPLTKKAWTIMKQTMWLMSNDDFMRKNIEMPAGLGIHLARFRRPLMGALGNLWSLTLVGTPRPSQWRALVEDLPWMFALVRLAGSSGALSIHDATTASDVSKTGDGVCVSIRRAQLGRSRLAKAEAMQGTPPADCLLLLDVFGGISSTRRALQVLGVIPRTHVDCETGTCAQLVVLEDFQGVDECGDIG